MDSIANFNDTEDAQLLPETYQTQLPEFSAAVKQNGYKGDFIGVIGRKEDQPLYELVSNKTTFLYGSNQAKVSKHQKVNNISVAHSLPTRS